MGSSFDKVTSWLKICNFEGKVDVDGGKFLPLKEKENVLILDRKKYQEGLKKTLKTVIKMATCACSAKT